MSCQVQLCCSFLDLCFWHITLLFLLWACCLDLAEDEVASDSFPGPLEAFDVTYAEFSSRSGQEQARLPRTGACTGSHR